MHIDQLETPAVLIDIDRVEANLNRAQDHARTLGYDLRPHIKTHKLVRFARRQIELGAVGITAQKLGEAEVMADGGIEDIFIPYNIVGSSKLARLAALHARVRLSVTADSIAAVDGYAATFTAPERPLPVLVECDSGGGRCGVQDVGEALALARRIDAAPGLRFGGLMTYPAVGRGADTIAWLAGARAAIEAAGLPVERVSAGNSPDIWAPRDDVVSERRPGTYIYFDRSQVAFGSAAWTDCALTVLTTVVSRPRPERIVLDAGSKALTSDLFGMQGHGVIAGAEDVVVTSLSEEHGVIVLPHAEARWPVGERVRIIPNHACVVSNLFDRVHLVRGDRVVATERVDARGRSD